MQRHRHLSSSEPVPFARTRGRPVYDLTVLRRVDETATLVTAPDKGEILSGICVREMCRARVVASSRTVRPRPILKRQQRPDRAEGKRHPARSSRRQTEMTREGLIVRLEAPLRVLKLQGRFPDRPDP